MLGPCRYPSGDLRFKFENFICSSRIWAIQNDVTHEGGGEEMTICKAIKEGRGSKECYMAHSETIIYSTFATFSISSILCKDYILCSYKYVIFMSHDAVVFDCYLHFAHFMKHAVYNFMSGRESKYVNMHVTSFSNGL